MMETVHANTTDLAENIILTCENDFCFYSDYLNPVETSWEELAELAILFYLEYHGLETMERTKVFRWFATEDLLQEIATDFEGRYEGE